MDSVYFSAFAALGGSVIGGLTSLATSWLIQHTQLRAQQYAQNVGRRETLYEDFVAEASRLYLDAFEHDKTELSSLVRLYAMIGRMRVLSSPKVVEDAHKVARLIIETYLAPNKTFRDARDMAENHAVDPLRGFTEACREELRRLGAF